MTAAPPLRSELLTDLAAHFGPAPDAARLARAFPDHDFAAIDRYRAVAKVETGNWRAWFTRHGITPPEISHDPPAAAQEQAAPRQLSRLGIVPRQPPRAGTARLTDAIWQDGARRYRAESGR